MTPAPEDEFRTWPEFVFVVVATWGSFLGWLVGVVLAADLHNDAFGWVLVLGGIAWLNIAMLSNHAVDRRHLHRRRVNPAQGDRSDAASGLV